MNARRTFRPLTKTFRWDFFVSFWEIIDKGGKSQEQFKNFHSCQLTHRSFQARFTNSTVWVFRCFAPSFQLRSIGWWEIGKFRENWRNCKHDNFLTIRVLLIKWKVRKVIESVKNWRVVNSVDAKSQKGWWKDVKILGKFSAHKNAIFFLNENFIDLCPHWTRMQFHRNV